MDISEGFQPSSVAELHHWLAAEHSNYPLWVIIYNKKSGKHTVTYEEVVEEAICFGLIDGRSKNVDEERWGIALFKRRPHSHWTDTNKAIARRLIAEKRMTSEGQKIFDDAADA